MEHIRIDSTDVILQDFEDGKGKIIISNDEYGYNFSYYWGAMGKDTDIKKFIKSISCDYFVKKLSNHSKGVLNVRKTFSSLRRYIKECIEYELKWFEHMEFQKEFRKSLRDLQNEVSCEIEFIDKINRFNEELNFYLIEDKNERDRLEKLFKGIFCYGEARSFLENEPHVEDVFLEKLHAKLKNKLSKPVQLCLF